jgi:EAL domain-containing protein (putative c-di-GMP-specific phosphodiesterase class I)
MSKFIDNQVIKNQRNRFLAFSFAAADLLIETDAAGTIEFTLGATQNLTGMSEDKILGKKWHELFVLKDQSYLKKLLETAKAGQRTGPILIEIANKRVKAIFSAIRMPESDALYITLTLANELADLVYTSPETHMSVSKHSKQAFQDIIEDKINAARELDKKTSLTFLDLHVNREYKEEMGKRAWEKLENDITSSLKESSLEGNSLGHICEHRYGILHDEEFDTENLRKQLQSLLNDNNISKNNMSIDQTTILLDIENMSGKDATKALMYTLNEFERTGAQLDIKTLSNSIQPYLVANPDKAEEFKKIIQSSYFDLYFQPVVDLKNKELVHYETLSRFTHGNTQEWITFCEDSGMATNFDLAVTDRIMNHIHYKAANTRTHFSVNLSEQSIRDPYFVTKLTKQLRKYKKLEERLSFEIRQSHFIEQTEKVNTFVNILKNDGYQILLDDFDGSEKALELLEKLDIDGVKIDGKYIRRLRESQQDVALVKNITAICDDLGIKVIAESVEDAEQVKILQKIGVRYGQGYFFSRPARMTNYVNKQA